MLRKLKNSPKFTRGLSMVLLSALLILIAVSPSFLSAAAAKRLPVYSVARDDKCVSLTFDAAWGNAILRRA